MSESSAKTISSDFNIRVGTEDDISKIKDFAIKLSQDPVTSVNKWTKILKQENVYPLLAEINGKVVGKVQVRIIENIGWLESARVAPEHRKKGIAVSLLNIALMWIKNKGVKYIRAAVESDNLKIRLLLEKNNFTCHQLLINPSSNIESLDSSAEYQSKYSTLLDNSVYPEFVEIINKSFSGNIMVDGQYIPFTEDLFNYLIDEKRILINGKSKSFLIMSHQNLNDQLETFVFAQSEEMYKELGLVSKALAAQELAHFVVCHAPARRMAVQGLILAGLGWHQPHTLIIYQRNNK